MPSFSVRRLSVLLSLIILVGLLLPTFISVAFAQSEPSSVIENWWPVDGAHVSGTQPFKVQVPGRSVDSYSVTWSVDGGARNPMDTVVTDAPHKEASVDLSGWRWQSSGNYAVTFTATDSSGQTIGQKTVTIVIDGAAASSSSSPVSSSASTSESSMNRIMHSVLSSPSSSAVSSPASAASLNVWWPMTGSNLSGVQPFKIVAQGLSLSSYSATWSVDGGRENAMVDSQSESPHKEAMVDVSAWNWKGAGPYSVTFRIRDRRGALLASQAIAFYAGSVTAPSSVAGSTSSASSSSTTSTVLAPKIPETVAGNPLSGISLYVNPNAPAKAQADAWRSSRPGDAALMDSMAAQPVAQWLGGWNTNVGADVKTAMNAAASRNAVPAFVLYNIPGRDCGGYSAGGTQSADAYRSWVRSIADAIGSRKAVVVLEPDAVSLTDCLSANDRATRYQLLGDAVRTLKSQGSVAVYMDAGHPNWLSASAVADRLRSASIDAADGFALNVSNFETEAANASFGAEVSSLTGGKHFVVDTSRNGLGPAPDHQWCNPSGRALGRTPTASTGNSLIDAYLWIKTPGESDGSCNGGPNAGNWWGDYALGLAQRASH